MEIKTSPSAPIEATYIVQTADGTLTAEQVLGSLSTGIMKVATTTGVISSVAAPAGVVVGDTDVQTLAGKTLSSLVLASGASTSGNFSITPIWTAFGASSAATTNVGRVVMPHAGTFQFFNVVLNGPVSGASVIIDINKNGTSIFEAGTRPFILGAGTFVSTASIATKTFIAGDIMSLDLDALGNLLDFTVEGYAGGI